MAWLPPAAAGAAGAASAELAVGLLLYVRGGFVGALTLILCAEAAALAFGFWAAPRDGAPPWTGMRRAWFVLLLSLVLGASVAAGWETLGGLAGTWFARGIGLACLAALPLYATGAVLGAPALGEGERAVATGPSAAAGAALGFGLVGLGRSALRVAPLAYVAGVVLVSIGALVHSRLLEEREELWRESEVDAALDGADLELPPVPPSPPSLPFPRDRLG
jgi:hypothetical protein